MHACAGLQRSFVWEPVGRRIIGRITVHFAGGRYGLWRFCGPTLSPGRIPSRRRNGRMTMSQQSSPLALTGRAIVVWMAVVFAGVVTGAAVLYAPDGRHFTTGILWVVGCF